MPFKSYQNSFNPSKRPGFDFHSLPDLQERPWLSGQPGSNSSLDGNDIRIVNRNRAFSNSHNLDDSRRHKYWKPIKWIEPAEQVAGK